MYTTLDYILEELSDEIILKIFKNCIKQNVVDDLFKNTDNLMYSLSTMFNWRNSIEGYDYWNEIYNFYLNK